MKALFYPSFDLLELNDQPVPGYNDNEVLVKVSACGICGSELETFKNRSLRRTPPLIMGHEFCGVIVAKGSSVKNWEIGDRVVSNSIVSCGQCNRCKTGETNLCVNRQVFGIQRNGAFSEFVNVPACCLIDMPSTVLPRAACLSEPLANGIHMVKLTEHKSLKKILIIGAGPIGLMAQQAFQVLRGVRTIVLDLKDERLAVARRVGAEAVINPRVEDFHEKIMEVIADGDIDLVIDAVGNGETNLQALKLVRSGGVVVIIGLHENNNSMWSYDITLSEKQVFGTYAATQDDMKEALAMIAAGKVDVTSWMHYYSLDQGVAAFNNMMNANGNHIKSILLIDDIA